MKVLHLVYRIRVVQPSAYHEPEYVLDTSEAFENELEAQKKVEYLNRTNHPYSWKKAIVRQG